MKDGNSKVYSRMRWVIVAFWVIAIALWVSWPKPEILTRPASAGENENGAALFWFKGNTHAHAAIEIEGWKHGNASREKVADWYRTHGYHFAAISDHNAFTEASSLNQPAENDSEFLLLNGMEVTSDHRYPGMPQEGQRKIHSTALATESPVDWSVSNMTPSNILKQHQDRIRSAGGLAIVNHPNYRFQLTQQDIEAAGNVRFMELFNAHPRSNHAGHAGFRPSVEGMWDQLLGKGLQVYGIASDDAHDFGWHMQALRRFGTAPPGGAWIMVEAPQLDRSSLLEAMNSGAFYASTGVYLESVQTTSDTYRVAVNLERTLHDIQHAWIKDAAPVIWSDDSHLVIEFIGPQGRVLQWSHDETEAQFDLTNAKGYVRVRITYLEKLPSRIGADYARAYYAWTQPVMIRSTSAN